MSSAGWRGIWQPEQADFEFTLQILFDDPSWWQVKQAASLR